MASVLMFPEPADLETASVGSYIAGEVRTIAFFLFAANLMLVAAEFPHVREVLHTNPAHNWGFYLPYNAAILACYAVMMATRSRAVVIAAMAALLLVYAWVTITGSV